MTRTLLLLYLLERGGEANGKNIGIYFTFDFNEKVKYIDKKKS